MSRRFGLLMATFVLALAAIGGGYLATSPAPAAAQSPGECFRLSQEYQALQASRQSFAPLAQQAQARANTIANTIAQGYYRSPQELLALQGQLRGAQATAQVGQMVLYDLDARIQQNRQAYQQRCGGGSY
jgi:hypothetical protein